MDLKASIMERLTENGIKIWDASAFVRDERRDPITKGGVASRYFARCVVKGPNEGLKVTIKILSTTNRDRILAEEFNNKGLVRERTWQYFKRECCILKRGEVHPNIQKCLGVVNGFEGDSLLGIVFKDVVFNDLREFIFSSNLATNATKLQLMRDVARALAFLHDNEILHRDVKSINVLVDIQDGKLVALLSDFGSAKDFINVLPIKNSTTRSSLQWMAPELIEDPLRMHDFEKGAADMWAFGCTMIEVLGRTRSVWTFSDDNDEIQEALEAKKRPERPPTFPQWDEAWKFIHDHCLNPAPSERISSRKAVEELGTLLETAPPN
ncbi:kinase-like protein [Schizopora paradoxa]|uniref:Kinase-like protein n=1 Tax=Schizopora paradoxa TaxID=27342 RepID=A0A0H2RGG1_9AGAM|nr:kinase-like protein [Schizopora paradoxa]